MITIAFVISALSIGAFFGHIWTAHIDRKIIARRDEIIRSLYERVPPKEVLPVEDPPFAMSIVNTTGGAIRVRAAFEPMIKAGTPVDQVTPAQRVGVAMLEYLDEIMTESGAKGVEAVSS